MESATDIGIMGGTFDPVHNGHMAIASSVADQLGLDRVLFIPAGNPNFKQRQEVTPAEERVAMVELAIEADERFELDRCEVDRPGVTYTADTLEELSSRYPGSRLYFIMGADSAITLPEWRRAEDVARMCTVVVAQRSGETAEAVEEALARCPIEFDVVYLDTPRIDVSSTDVRRRVAQGGSASGMTPPAIADYIAKEGLYA